MVLIGWSGANLTLNHPAAGADSGGRVQRYGTDGSNPSRSANQSVLFTYNLEMAENLRVTRRLRA